METTKTQEVLKQKIREFRKELKELVEKEGYDRDSVGYIAYKKAINLLNKIKYWKDKSIEAVLILRVQGLQTQKELLERTHTVLRDIKEEEEHDRKISNYERKSEEMAYQDNF